MTDFISSSNSSSLFATRDVTNIEDVGKAKVRELTDKEKEILQKQKEKKEFEEQERLRLEEEERNPISIEVDFDGWLR